MKHKTLYLPDGSTATTTEASNRPGFLSRPCEGECGRRFGKRDVVVIVETQTNEFRGDDEVTAWCPECFRGNFLCAVCEEPARGEYEGEPSCGRPRCELQIQAAADYHAEAGDR